MRCLRTRCVYRSRRMRLPMRCRLSMLVSVVWRVCRRCLSWRRNVRRLRLRCSRRARPFMSLRYPFFPFCVIRSLFLMSLRLSTLAGCPVGVLIVRMRMLRTALRRLIISTVWVPRSPSLLILWRVMRNWVWCLLMTCVGRYYTFKCLLMFRLRVGCRTRIFVWCLIP